MANNPNANLLSQVITFVSGGGTPAPTNTKALGTWSLRARIREQLGTNHDWGLEDIYFEDGGMYILMENYSTRRFQKAPLAVSDDEVEIGEFEEVVTVHVTKATDTDEGVVGGYLVTYGTENQKDIEREFFTSETDFKFEDGEVRPILFHHAKFAEIGAIPIGHATLERTEQGVYVNPEKSSLWVDGTFQESEFVEEITQRRAMYLTHLENIGWENVNAVAKAVNVCVQSPDGMAWSSGAGADSEKTDNGWWKTWSIEEATITWTPAEPQNNVAFEKAVDAVLSAMENKDMSGNTKDGNAADPVVADATGTEQLVGGFNATQQTSLLELVETAMGPVNELLQTIVADQANIKSALAGVQAQSEVASPQTLAALWRVRQQQSVVGNEKATATGAGYLKDGPAETPPPAPAGNQGMKDADFAGFNGGVA